MMLDLVRGVGVEARGRLIQEDEPRVAKQRDSNVAALCLPACGPATLCDMPHARLVAWSSMGKSTVCGHQVSSSCA